jgi:peptidylprolyl isomerase
MKLLTLSLLAVAASLPAMAQTSTPVHHATHTAAAHAAAGDACLMLQPISPKVPALPATASCPKALYTVTRLSNLKADYVSPLVSPALRESLETGNQTFTLGYVDIVKGTGAPATPGKYISVKYAGYLMDGTKFDASDDHPGKEPIDVPYGAHQVIQGWDTGFEGMHVGGKRRLFIPYELAYGDAGKGPIPAKAALVFDIELVGVSDGPAKRTQVPTADVKQTAPAATTVPPPSAANAPGIEGKKSLPSNEPKK